ncbi:MAG TPA: 4-hydroxybutyrate CoA-transferase, partial [Candidatus Avibacteroides faecavium]|nr:4-hydroxybutyrate CoA-transferase [Candidatus Avibacteroides faecavium]
MPHYVSADEAVKLIKSYDKIYVQGSGSIPEVLLSALVKRAGELKGVELYSGFAIAKGESPYCKKELLESFYPVSLFIAPSVRGAINRGEGQCIPSFLGEVPALFR